MSNLLDRRFDAKEFVLGASFAGFPVVIATKES